MQVLHRGELITRHRHIAVIDRLGEEFVIRIAAVSFVAGGETIQWKTAGQDFSTTRQATSTINSNTP